MELFSEYFKKDHILSKIDARIKILVSLAIIVMVLSYKGFVFPLLVLGLCTLLTLGMKIPLRVFLLRVSQPLFIASMIIILKFLFSGNDALFSANIFGRNITGYKDGLIEGLTIASRIIGGVSIVVAFGFATPFAEILAGLSWFKVPKSFVELLMLTYRYIFVLLEDAETIYNAQKNRLGYSGIKKGLSSFGTLTGSLILRAFEHSQKTTLAMVQRGYTGDMPVLRDRPLKVGEISIAAIFVIFVGAIWMI